jgi:hypothetical protein
VSYQTVFDGSDYLHEYDIYPLQTYADFNKEVDALLNPLYEKIAKRSGAIGGKKLVFFPTEVRFEPMPSARKPLERYNPMM